MTFLPSSYFFSLVYFVHLPSQLLTTHCILVLWKVVALVWSFVFAWWPVGVAEWWRNVLAEISFFLLFPFLLQWITVIEFSQETSFFKMEMRRVGCSSLNFSKKQTHETRRTTTTTSMKGTKTKHLFTKSSSTKGKIEMNTEKCRKDKVYSIWTIGLVMIKVQNNTYNNQISRHISIHKTHKTNM